MSYCADKLKMVQILTLKLNLTLKIKVNHPTRNRDLNQGLLHLWSKFDDLAWTGDELSRGQTWWRTEGWTDAGNDKTRRPILASGNKMHITRLSFSELCVVSCVHYNSLWPVKQPLNLWLHASSELTRTTSKLSTRKRCAYSMGFTAY